jgi:hypothetical protein
MATLNQTGLPDLMFRRSKMIRCAIALIQSFTLILAALAANAKTTPAQIAVQERVRVYSGPGNGDDYPVAIAVDTSGNVFVSGYSFGRGSGFDHATIKYSGAGVPLWTNRFDGPGIPTTRRRPWPWMPGAVTASGRGMSCSARPARRLWSSLTGSRFGWSRRC